MSTEKPPATQRRWSPSGKRLLWLLCAPLLVLAALAIAAGALWAWLGTDTSLASTLARAAAYLPAGHTLETSEVTGSVRQGGHIGSLAYRSPGLQVEAQDIAVEWQLDRLLQHELRLGRLHIGQLSIAQTPSTEPTVLPSEIVLPLQVDLPFEIADLRWQGPPALQLAQLAGNYRYDGTQHQLTVNSVQVASGRYAGQATLLARSPLTLQANVQGSVDTILPGNTRSLTVAATASASGPLAGQDALLQIQARVTPSTSTALQATLSAQIHPWAAQPVHQAEASFQQLNLADLWPDAPHTLLSGSAHVRPDPLATGTAWRAEATLDNRLSGPWDKNRVPLDHANTRLQYQQGAWVIESLSAQLGKGDVQLQGRWTGAGSTDWTAEAKLLRINPAALHTRMAPALLDGRVTASSIAAAIRFDAALQPSAKAPAIAALQGLRIQTAQATGRWAAGTLNLSALKLQTDDALLQGKLDLTLATRAAKGQLHLSLPGAQADVQGQISASQGAGDFALHVPDAGQATRWLARLPGVAASLPGDILGQAELTGRWTGGWASALAPGKAGTPPFQLTAQLAVPTLDIRPATGNPISLRKLQLDASGSLGALVVTLQGELATGTQRASLTTHATGGLGTANHWQARIASLALEMQDSTRPGPWTLQLDQALALQGTRTSVDAAAGSASVKGPVPGSVRIAWQPVAWSHDGSRSLLRTQGTLQGLPMGWLETLAAGNGQLAQLGLKGDLLLDGDWNVQAAQTLQVSANLYRKSGDLQLLNGDDAANGTPSTISAGIRTARIGLRTDGDKLSASLRWDSERAGQAEAELSTQVRQTDGSWLWPTDAPLNGTVRASLPRVGIWSVLAPPGWRLGGTLAANATLGGTRLAPLWTGTLQADDLALRSVVEGIELRDGRLRASLDGQRLNITEFSLRGAPTAANSTTAPPSGDGGSLSATGNVRWSNTAPAGIQMDIQAQAKTLRISARADRRLTVSGTLQATLAQGKLALQGALKADQALFILPDESAPTLGSDVLVRKRSSTTTPSTAAPVAASNTPEVNVTLDLGDDFHLVGRGLDTRLTGKLLLRAGPTLAGPRVTGELRTTRGSFKAYGQALDIEEGILRFNGPYDNPSLDVLAIRPNLSVRVGVQINGTALLPNIRLYSDSDLSDAEKLAWLVLGRSAANGGAEGAVLQQAALALLGGNGKGLSGGLASALGLDELSFSGSANKSDGTTSAAAVTFGKRLSRNFYVAYEHSLAGTLGTLYIFYDLSKRFTLRGQTGEQSAIDLIFTLQYD
ncbi:translocation/assembly module TamB domain-containing protein [Rhodoferax sp.]|uniref:translocation/assembly module TamB domain-containing protein n=1 Tax=Rhodoferax sp. TaxID=50421 RepID=UPI0025E678DF|nr:translocation/assembly module TamB domain-containing protein [Rhodoferax sp.]